MKKVFISYSFKDSELYIVTLLFEKLHKLGYSVESTNSNFDYVPLNKFYSINNIQNSNLFIGIITNESHSINHVLNEWRTANSKGIKTILIIENGVKVKDQNIKYISFDRHNPKPAIDKLFSIRKAPAPVKKDSESKDILVASAIILGIAALISLLSGDSKK